MSDTPETDAEWERAQGLYATATTMRKFSEKLECERDMLRKALVDILKVEDAPLFRDHLTVHGGTTFWIESEEGLAALDALQATAAKRAVQP